MASHKGLSALECQQTLKLTDELVDSRYPEPDMPTGGSHRPPVPRLPGPCPPTRGTAQGPPFPFPCMVEREGQQTGVRRSVFEVSSAISCATVGKSLFFWPWFSHAERDLFIDSLIQSLASYQMFIDTGTGPVAESTGGNSSSLSSLAAETHCGTF